MAVNNIYNPYHTSKDYRNNVSFKSKHSFENRCKESNNIIKKYPERVPVIVEKQEHSDAIDIDFGDGSISNSTFKNINGDAIDVSGSYVKLSSSY